MKEILCSLLLLLMGTTAQGQDTLHKLELSAAIGINTNTPLQEFRGVAYGDRMLLSRSFVGHCLRSFSQTFSLGLRIESTQWRNAQAIRYIDSNTRLPGDDLLTYNLGQGNSTFALCGKWRPRKMGLTAGAYIGFAAGIGKETVNNGRSGGGEVYHPVGQGFVAGVEGGYQQPLGKGVALEVLGAVQYLQFESGRWNSSFLFAFPVTVGLVFFTGEKVLFHSQHRMLR